jgi:hypothetical protein
MVYLAIDLLKEITLDSFCFKDCYFPTMKVISLNWAIPSAVPFTVILTHLKGRVDHDEQTNSSQGYIRGLPFCFSHWFG